eukprot:TRINITY_DN8131_c0_g2_i1.p1 TRINITY_DN8131_c0_g2~~TRINITY_DN8131_c0_g2_i1.p1  ORF type:complete len:218 (-),score=46.88 TRINITY_DN8131_c0_g2_i1:86-739(-)
MSYEDHQGNQRRLLTRREDFYAYSSLDSCCGNNQCCVFLCTNSKKRTAIAITIILLVLLALAVFLVIFFLSPRSPSLSYRYATGATLNLATQPYSSNIHVTYKIENPNYFTLDVKMVELAAYFGPYALGVGYDTLSLGMRDDDKVTLTMKLDQIPTQMRNEMVDECAATGGTVQVRFDGFVGVKYLFYEDWWRTRWVTKYNCNGTTTATTTTTTDTL